MKSFQNKNKEKNQVLRLSAAIVGSLAVLAPASIFPVSQAKAQPALAFCPNIEGAFQRPGDNLTVFFNQSNCRIRSDAPSERFEHTVRGKWSGSYFDVQTTRQNIRNGCTTRLYGRIYVINDFKLRSVVYASDGRCDLPKNYTENSIWYRV